MVILGTVPTQAQHVAQPRFFNERLACPSANKIVQTGGEDKTFIDGGGYTQPWDKHYGFDKSKNPSTAVLAATEAGREALINYYDKANEMANGCHPCFPVIMPPTLVVGLTGAQQEVVARGILSCVVP
jgi:hypothetical protein